MKQQVLGILFYLLYLLAMVRPLIPIIEYHANYDYIANILCENRDKPSLACHGKCYLEKQLKKNKDNHSHNSTIPQIDFDKYPVCPLDLFLYETKDFCENNNKLVFDKEHSSQIFLKSIFKPPQITA